MRSCSGYHLLLLGRQRRKKMSRQIRSIRFYSRDAAGLFRRMGKAAYWAFHVLLWNQYCEPVSDGRGTRQRIKARIRPCLNPDSLVTLELPDLTAAFEEELRLYFRHIRKCGLELLLEDLEVPVTLQKRITLRNPEERLYWKLWLVFDRAEVCRQFLERHEAITSWQRLEFSSRAHNRLLNLLAQLIAAYRSLPDEVHDLFIMRGLRTASEDRGFGTESAELSLANVMC